MSKSRTVMGHTLKNSPLFKLINLNKYSTKPKLF
jgi:hypothetical protein